MNVASVCRLFPTPSDPSCGVFVDNRVSAMANHMGVRKIQPVPYFPGIRPFAEWPQHLQTDVSRVPMFYFPKVLKSLDGFWLAKAVRTKLAKLADEGQLDLIDAHFGYPDGVGCQRIAQELGVPLVVTLRGVENEQLDERLIGGQIRNLLQRADGCVCVSGFLADLARKNGVDESRLRVIHNAVDRAVFSPGCRETARAKLGMESANRRLICVGQLIPRKRQDVLVQAFARIKDQYPDVVLDLIGSATDKGYVGRVRSLISSLDLSERVVLHGVMPPDRVAEYLRAADVFSLLSSREGCCNAILEALACGAPVVTTPVGDNEFFVTEGENGYFAPVDDPEASASALERALDLTPWNSLQISNNLQVGDWDTVAIKVEQFFREVLG